MKQIDFKTSNYEDKEALATFLNEFNDLLEKYEKSHTNADASLKRVETNIDKKKTQISKLENTIQELTKREEELEELKNSSNDEIRELESKKRSVEYTDSEVQKMELEDLDSLINARKSKISKIDTKLESTREKVKINSDSKKDAEQELSGLEKDKRLSEESLYRTNAILNLVGTTKETFNQTIRDIIDSEYIDLSKPEIETQPMMKKNEEDNEFTVVEYSLADMDVPDLGIDESTLDIEKAEVETSKEETETSKKELEAMSNTEELNILDFTMAAPVEQVKEEVMKETERSMDYTSLLEDVFNKEAISFSDFSEEVRTKMLEHADRVIKNVVVLKKHQIPLELTLNQNEIYYGIEPQDLDDLLNIVTTDEDGNGMGFTIDYTYYILNELAKINVDKLIDVYNNEFMNVNAKSGIIWLLKLTNPDLTDFAANRKINTDTLKSLGVNAVEAVASEYPEFINMDNPLFISALNLFDKDDLVDKLNTDIKIVPKIMEYWKNNN